MDNISKVEPKELYTVLNTFLYEDDDKISLNKIIYNYTRGRIDDNKVVYILKNQKSTINDYYYANNIADSLIEILENHSDPEELIINMVPHTIKRDGDNVLADRLISIYEYLGFRQLDLIEDYIIMVYMNSTGIRIFNITLDRKEYDYGK